MSIYAYGWRIGIRVNKPEVLSRIAERLPPGWEPGCSPLVDRLYSFRVGGQEKGSKVRNYTMLYSGLTQLARTMDLEAALDALESDLQTFVAEWAKNRVFVHAGVAAWNGKAIVLPGRSRAGKSTLVAALLRAGAAYYSDEYAVLDAGGRVHPFARRLALRSADGRPSQRVTPEELGSTAAMTPLPVGVVAVTRYQAGASWSPRPLSPGKAVLGLMNNTIPAEREPDMVLGTLEKVAAQGCGLTGVRGEADEAAAALLQAAA